MSLLSPQMRAMIRQVAERMMSSTCLIEKEQDSRGSLGQSMHTWQIVASAVRCRLITSKGATLTAVEPFADRITMEDTYTISLPVGTEIGVDYRITVGSVVFRVANVKDNRTDSADAQAVLTRMRQDES